MKKTVSILIAFIFCVSCSKSNSETPTPTPTPITPSPIVTVTISPLTTYQTITGFGAANRMWGTTSLLPADAQKAFGLGDGELGLSIFRVRLSSNQSEWSIILEAVKEANKRGVKVLASPWSPPAALKDNNSDIGGSLLPQNYTAYKSYMNSFINYMSTNGAKIDVVSIQNEPDWNPSYESCAWTADNMINFLTAPGSISGVQVAAPESLNFNQTFTNSILSNDSAAAKISIIAGHIYGGGIAKFPIAEQKNKEIWMTEYLLNLNTGNTGAPAWGTYSEADKWDESLRMLASVHDALSNNWNAYIWWYLQRYYSFIGDGEQATVNGEVLKRGYAFSHFAKFVRPGFIRINAAPPAGSSLKISAYKKDSQTVVVIINADASAVNNVEINGLTFTSGTSYTTSLSGNLSKKTLTVTNSKPTIDMLAKSVTTLVLIN